ncbi:MAG: DUF1653 domain-containing protein [Meiothermus sp.]
MQLQHGLYEHYKGKRYWVYGLARHSETEEWLVVYETRYGQEPETMWVRPLAMFLEDVEIEGQKIPRFRYLGAQEDRAS